MSIHDIGHIPESLISATLQCNVGIIKERNNGSKSENLRSAR
jgi:hypothetical protein